MQIDPIRVIADQQLEIDRLRRRVDDLLGAANVAVDRRRAMKARAIELCVAMENDQDVPEGAHTAAWNLKVGMMNL